MPFFHSILVRVSFFSLLVFPLIAIGQAEFDPPVDTSGKIINPISANSFPEFIQKILEGVLKIGMPIIALAIIYAGFLFVEARGNPEKITKAKRALTYTVIGAAILLGSWVLAKLISDTVLSL